MCILWPLKYAKMCFRRMLPRVPGQLGRGHPHHAPLSRFFSLLLSPPGAFAPQFGGGNCPLNIFCVELPLVGSAVRQPTSQTMIRYDDHSVIMMLCAGVLQGASGCCSCTHRPAVPGECPPERRAAETRRRPHSTVPSVIPVASKTSMLFSWLCVAFQLFCTCQNYVRNATTWLKLCHRFYVFSR